MITTPEQVEEVKASLGELPAQLRTRLTTDFGLSPYDAVVLVNQGRELVEYYLKVADQSGDAKTACNWVTQDVLRVLKEQEKTIGEIAISAVADGKLPKSRARNAFEVMVDQGGNVQDAISKLAVEQVDESQLVALCRELLDKNPKIVADLRSGKHQAVGALIGQAKQRNPNVDPGQVREICLKLIQQ